MATITVKNIPDEIYSKIKEAAQNQHRSVNSLVIELLETKAKTIAAIQSRPDILEQMRKFRARVGPFSENSTDILRKIRDEGEMYEE